MGFNSTYNLIGKDKYLSSPNECIDTHIPNSIRRMSDSFFIYVLDIQSILCNFFQFPDIYIALKFVNCLPMKMGIKKTRPKVLFFYDILICLSFSSQIVTSTVSVKISE